ncbi:MAG: hypothetical protein GY898_01590 [Proteobacteria bacterium]|nr:hypothetical protein [Pseudomonadota bacterium]
MPPAVVEGALKTSAGEVLEQARALTREAFDGLRALGFEVPPGLAEGLTEAIVGDDGAARIDALRDQGAA